MSTPPWNPFKYLTIRISIKFIIMLATLLPSLANSHAMAGDANRQAKIKAMTDQNKVHARQREKAKQTKLPSTWGSVNPWAQTGPTRKGGQRQPQADQAPGLPRVQPSTPRRSPWQNPLARCLQPGFAFLLLAGSTGLCPSQAQYPLATDLFSALSAFNLSTSSPANAPVVEGLHRALGRGNMTGGLPPLTELNTLLAAGSPFRTSPLATLPQPPSPPPSAPPAEGTLHRTLTTPPSLPGNPSAVPFDSNLSDDLLVLTTTLTVAQLIETQATLLSISYQFLAAAELQGTNLQVRMPLRIVAMELQSLAFAFGARANHEQAEAAERAIAKRLQMEAAHDSPSGPGTMPTSTLPEGAELLAATLDPNLIYGTWQRLETSGPGQRILYKIGRAHV